MVKCKFFGYAKNNINILFILFSLTSHLSLSFFVSHSLSSLSPFSLSHFLKYYMALSIMHQIGAHAGSELTLSLSHFLRYELNRDNRDSERSVYAEISSVESSMQGPKTRRGFRSVVAVEFVQIASAWSDTSQSISPWCAVGADWVCLDQQVADVVVLPWGLRWWWCFRPKETLLGFFIIYFYLFFYFLSVLVLEVEGERWKGKEREREIVKKRIK